MAVRHLRRKIASHELPISNEIRRSMQELESEQRDAIEKRVLQLSDTLEHRYEDLGDRLSPYFMRTFVELMSKEEFFNAQLATAHFLGNRFFRQFAPKEDASGYQAFRKFFFTNPIIRDKRTYARNLIAFHPKEKVSQIISNMEREIMLMKGVALAEGAKKGTPIVKDTHGEKPLVGELINPVVEFLSSNVRELKIMARSINRS